MTFGAPTAFSTMSIDMYLPAPPQISRELGVSLAMEQLSITAFLFGSVAGQIVYGIFVNKYTVPRIPQILIILTKRRNADRLPLRSPLFSTLPPGIHFNFIERRPGTGKVNRITPPGPAPFIAPGSRSDQQLSACRSTRNATGQKNVAMLLSSAGIAEPIGCFGC